jgi:MFS family permease
LEPPRAISSSRRIYTLAALTIAFAFAYIDRSIISVLLPAIKREFHVGDAALAFLSGLAFALSFVILGIPIAGWADRGDRRRIIAIAVAAWSAMTVVCGLAASLPQLILARVGVGVGEAGLSPPAHSIISDLFPPKMRGFALAIYQSGVNAGVLLGLILGGYLAQRLGWRGAFFVLGAPGLAVALLIGLTVAEPQRGRFDAVAADAEKHANLVQVIAHIWRTKPIRYAFLGMGLCAMVNQTQGVWLPSFLTRSHHLPIAKVGLYLGLASGIGGAIGTIVGGRLSDALGARDERWRLRIVTVAMLISPLCVLSVLFVQNLTLLFLASGTATMLGAAHLAPTLATIQNLTPLRMRARAASLVIFILNLLGLGLGPLIVGTLSDRLQPIVGADSLRYALTPVLLFALLAAAAYFAAGEAYGVYAKGAPHRLGLRGAR